MNFEWDVIQIAINIDVIQIEINVDVLHQERNIKGKTLVLIIDNLCFSTHISVDLAFKHKLWTCFFETSKVNPYFPLSLRLPTK